MSEIRRFRDLEVWNVSMELVLRCYVLTDRYPLDEKFSLARETRRSATSIPSNIAEGHNRHRPRAYRNHVNIALGSQAELERSLKWRGAVVISRWQTRVRYSSWLPVLDRCYTPYTAASDGGRSRWEH